MKKKIIICSIICSITVIMITTITFFKNISNKNEEKELTYNNEVIEIFDEENLKIDNELVNIESQIVNLEEQMKDDTDKVSNEEIIKNTSELKSKKEQLNIQKQENTEKKNDIIVQEEQEKSEITENISNSNQSQQQSITNSSNDKENEISKEENNRPIEQQYTINVSSTDIILEEGQIKSFDVHFTNPKVNEFSFDITDKSNNVIVHTQWTSLKNNKTTVTVEGKKVGKTEIKITERNTPNIIRTVTVTVIPKTKVQGIFLNKTYIDAKVGKNYQIVATITPENAQDKSINWTSSNENIATVWDGHINAIGIGTAIITATTSDGGHVANCTIKVTEIPVEGIEITTRPELNYYVGETVQLKYTTIPYDATNQKVIWKSDNTNIATVDSNGIVTFKKGIKYTDVHITVTTEEGGFSDLISLYCVPEQ